MNMEIKNFLATVDGLILNLQNYLFMAPTPEAMRIWVDVLFTGAEGYREFQN